MKNVYVKNVRPYWTSICFGQVEVKVLGCDVTRQASRRAMLLLAFLALHQREESERSWLAGMLWPYKD